MHWLGTFFLFHLHGLHGLHGLLGLLGFGRGRFGDFAESGDLGRLLLLLQFLRYTPLRVSLLRTSHAAGLEQVVEAGPPAGRVGDWHVELLV